MGWGVTTAEVQSTTGQSVSSTDLAMAESSVEIYINRTPALSGDMRTTDLYWIQTAIKWQAAWIKDQPDYAARSLVTQQNQDGASVDFPVESSITLAPLARRALKNVSWKASRTLAMPGTRIRMGQVDPTLEAHDPYNWWFR